MSEVDPNIDARQRYDQAMVDADIEGMAKDPEIEALVAGWRAEGIDAETRIARLKQLYRDRHFLPAE